MKSPIENTRRAFLGLGFMAARRPAAIRPPWAILESFAANCTRCNDCVAACPEGVLSIDPDGLPEVDFSRGTCTFCGDCAAACSAPVFDRTLAPAWQVSIAILDQCLPKRGVLCESCREVCLDGAIQFERVAGQAATPIVSAADCTGCGACVSICPVQAIGATPQGEQWGAGGPADA